jgi:hypothetical protein
MAKVNIYPTKYELTEVLATITNRGFLNSFAQQKGIFITHVDIETLAQEVSNLFLDNEDLETIRKEAYQSNSNHALSGFVVKSADKNFDLKTNYQWIFDQGKQKLNQKLTQLVKVKDTEIYKGSIEYVKKKAGRIEFLQDEVTQFDFYIEQVNPGIWQVEVDGTRSTDSKELRELFSEVITRETEVLTLEQGLLNTESSILFFDRLANEGMANDWNFKTVTHLTIKRGDDDGTEENEETEVVNTEDLVGITQAILQGENLRENLFVKQSVKSGYRFNAMTYEFAHKKEPYFLELKAEFKGRPKVFEVTIADYQEVIGTTPTREKVSIPDAHSRKIRSEFWNKSKAIFDEIVKRK